jgi:hypothetical protein
MCIKDQIEHLMVCIWFTFNQYINLLDVRVQKHAFAKKLKNLVHKEACKNEFTNLQT